MMTDYALRVCTRARTWTTTLAFRQRREEVNIEREDNCDDDHLVHFPTQKRKVL